MQDDDYKYEQPPGWTRVKPAAFADAPFEMYVNHFSSGSARMEAFIKDPRRFLRGEAMEEFGVEGEPIEGVTDATRVQTWLVNHHRTLMRMILYATAIVSSEEDTVYVTAFKQEPSR